MTIYLDDTKPLQITENIWWTGFADYESGFSNNSYLYKAGSESILIDPGPAHPVFRDVIVHKIQSIIPLGNIRYIILQHQDPDICGLVPYLENMLHPELTIICHPRTALFIPYYGIRRGVLPVGDDDTLHLPGGQRLIIYHLPYLHFSGNICVFEPDSSALFSSDIFAFFDRSWKFYVNKDSLDNCRAFIENYFGSEKALRYAYKKLKKLSPEMILAQHGGVIKDNIDQFLELLRDSKPAQALQTVGRTADTLQKQELFQIGKRWFEEWSEKETTVTNLEELYDVVLQEGPTPAAVFLDIIGKKSHEWGVNNPLLSGRSLSSQTIQNSEPSCVISSVKRRYLQKFYAEVPFHRTTKSLTGFASFKADIMIIFIDIRRFTQWCENKEPDYVIDVLNKQYHVISQVIERAGGRVNKFLGDGMLAYFSIEQVTRGVQVLFQIPSLIHKEGLLPVGMGSDVGRVIIGDIGIENRLDYTLLGQPVNLASRLSNSAKANEVVLSDNVRQCISTDVWEKWMKKWPNRAASFQQKVHDPVLETYAFQVL